jgi:NAD(P)H-hydrate repair Nnr-like enzyme with NAD(P)H-hydrate dehydratase domain
MLAQGLEPFEAAVCGAYLHALAGEITVRQMGIPLQGAAGLLAGDLLPALPQAIGRIRAGDLSPARFWVSGA